MSSDRIAPSERSTAYTPRPIGERREQRDEAKAKRKKKSRKREKDEADDAPREDDPDDPPHLVDIRTAGGSTFRIEM